MKIAKYILLTALTCAGARADNPLFNYQGRLLNDSGQPVNGSVEIAVNIYTSETSGVAAYAETVGSIAVQNGLYSFSYGTNVSAVRLALGNEESWLELVINSSPLSPRQRLHYTPYAMSMDENGLFQSTQFLLDMVAKLELEMQAVRAQLGLLNTSIGSQHFTEAFPDANGLNDLVVTNLTDAIYNAGLHLYGGRSMVVTSVLSEVSTTNILLTTVKAISNVNSYLSYVLDEATITGQASATGKVYYIFKYSGGAIITNYLVALFTNGVWSSVRVDNPMPAVSVSVLSIALKRGDNGVIPTTVREKNTRLIYDDTNSLSASRVVVQIPSVTGLMTHAALYATIVSDGGGTVQFELTDGVGVISNIPLNTKCALFPLTNNPSLISVLLNPSPTNELVVPSIESVMFKWWED